MEMAPCQLIIPLKTFPPSHLICVQHQNSFCLPLSSFKRAYGMVRRCEHFTEICLDEAILGGLWLWMQVRECVEDLSRLSLKIEATRDKAVAQALLRKYAILTP
jgi:hypothetical protein